MFLLPVLFNVVSVNLAPTSLTNEIYCNSSTQQSHVSNLWRSFKSKIKNAAEGVSDLYGHIYRGNHSGLLLYLSYLLLNFFYLILNFIQTLNISKSPKTFESNFRIQLPKHSVSAVKRYGNCMYP
jgi:hypothetical protein